MKRVLQLLLLACVTLTLAVLAPVRAHADGFQQAFTVPGWTFYSWLGNLDFDGQDEILMLNNAGGYFGIFDSGNGTLELPLFAVKPSNGSVVSFDYDGDGHLEFATTTDDGASHRDFAVWHWQPGGYVPYFSHHEPIVTFHTAHLRSTATLDLIEYRSNDILVRDVPTGAVLWRASTNIAGWHGTGQPFAQFLDVNGNGVDELMVSDNGYSFRVLQYGAGTWQLMWLKSGAWELSSTYNTDNDPQPELELRDASNLSGLGEFALVDGITGASELDLSAFTGFHYLIPVDNDGDGRSEILVHQYSPSLVRSYGFNGVGYSTLFSHSDLTAGIGPIHTRAANQTEYLEVSQTDLRVRDEAGNVLFRASTSLSNWSVDATLVTTSDIDHDGGAEMLIHGNSREWLLKYNSGFQELWSHAGRQVTTSVGNVDGDAQDELLAVDTADQTYMLLDGLTGVQQKHWPQYTYNHAQATFGPWENNGRNSLLFSHSYFSPGPHPINAVYRWDGVDVSAAFTFADSVLVVRASQNRSATLWEIEEWTPSNDLILRDAVNGSIRFQASRQLAGWTGLNVENDPRTLGRVYDDRNNRETLINELGRMTVIRRNATLDAPGATTPGAMRVLPSMPNPFRSATTLRFQMPRDAQAQIRIFDTAGRVVRTLDRPLTAGGHTVEWDGMDDAGQPSPNGVLFYSVTVGGERQTMKIVRLR